MENDNASAFDSIAWLKAYNKVVSNGNGMGAKALRKQIAEGTIEICDRKSYRLPDGTIRTVNPSPNTRCLRYNFKAERVDFSRYPRVAHENSIIVINQDCLDAEAHMRRVLKLNPCVLNMASASRPGGGWLNGAGAQEENLFRRSNYHKVAIAEHYPLPEFGGVYASGVSVFRSSEATGYALLDEPQSVAFVGVAACRNPEVVATPDGTSELAPKVYDITLRKIRSILDMAIVNGHDSIVLSAFGCGAFANPPRSMAKAFHEVLCNDADYAGRFKLVVFAIIDDHNAKGEGNFAPFRDMFNV